MRMFFSGRSAVSRFLARIRTVCRSDPVPGYSSTPCTCSNTTYACPHCGPCWCCCCFPRKTVRLVPEWGRLDSSCPGE